MKISNSKKQLAKIISENGGWRDGANFSAQDRLGASVDFYEGRPRRDKDDGYWYLPGSRLKAETFEAEKVIANWHQTILSRDEYFHLYPVQDADGWIEWKGGECPVDDDAIVEVFLRKGRSSLDGPKKASRWDWSNDGVGGDIIKYRLHKPEHAEQEYPDGVKPTDPAKAESGSKPTLEQLAAEYRNRKDYAERKQQEADEAKAEAEAKLAELVAAGKAVGLVVRIAAPESELIITDWRDLQVGDEVEYLAGKRPEMVGEIRAVVGFDANCPRGLHVDLGRNVWPREWRFIRRPAKEADNA